MPNDLMQTIVRTIGDAMADTQRQVRQITDQTVVGWKYESEDNSVNPIYLHELAPYFQQLIRDGHQKRVGQ